MASEQPTATTPQRPLPPGVTRGLWEYVHSEAVAEDYDDYFVFNKLFEFDEQVVAKHFAIKNGQEATVVADLGCGTGRALLPLVKRGFAGLAIDLSQDMLDVVRQKAEQECLNIRCLRANLVQLDELEDDSVDYAMCLFSTLGMIRGRNHRRGALVHARRILKPGGVLVLHVHNYWYNLYDPDGPWWLISNWLRSLIDRQMEAGDKYFSYRGLPQMFLHVFTRGEVRRTLRQAGFQVAETIPLDRRRLRTLRMPWLFGRLRANGWIVVCQ